MKKMARLLPLMGIALALAAWPRLAGAEDASGAVMQELAPGGSDTTGSTSAMGEIAVSDFAPVATDAATTLPQLAIEMVLNPSGETADLPDLDTFMEYVRSKNKTEQAISLNEVVLRTLAQNLNIHLSDILNRISHDQFHAAEGIFDLRVAGSAAVNRARPSAIDATGLKSQWRTKVVSGEGGLAQLLPTGGLVEVLFGDTSNRTNQLGVFTPYYTSAATLKVSHPLLRNAGPVVTQSQIIIAQYNQQVTAAQFVGQVITEVSRSIQLYLDLIFAYSNVDVLRISLAQAQELLRINEAKFKAGVVPELDVLQAKADVAARQQEVIAAIQQVSQASDVLKVQLAEIVDQRDVLLRPVESPRVPSFEVNEQEFLKEASEYNPSIQQVQWQIEKAKLNVEVAHNQTLPGLDVFSDYSSVGVNTGWSDSNRDAVNGGNGAWSLGLQFNYPLQNRTANYNFYASEKSYDAAVVRLNQVRDGVVFEVRDGIRSVETNREQIKVGLATVEFNKEKVDTGMKRQAVGLATSFDVLAFQRDLANARIALLRSVIDYNKAIAVVEASKGTLLQNLGISVDDCAIQAPKKITPKMIGTQR